MNKEEEAIVSDKLYQSVRRVIQESRRVVSRIANFAMVETYWRVGHLIVENEQQGSRKAEYGKAVLADLAPLSRIFARGEMATLLKVAWSS